MIVVIIGFGNNKLKVKCFAGNEIACAVLEKRQNKHLSQTDKSVVEKRKNIAKAKRAKIVKKIKIDPEQAVNACLFGLESHYCLTYLKSLKSPIENLGTVKRVLLQIDNMCDSKSKTWCETKSKLKSINNEEILQAIKSKGTFDINIMTCAKRLEMKKKKNDKKISSNTTICKGKGEPTPVADWACNKVKPAGNAGKSYCEGGLPSYKCSRTYSCKKK